MGGFIFLLLETGKVDTTVNWSPMPPLVTGLSNKFKILVGQESDYTETHRSQSQKYKFEIGQKQLARS
jgi:hypothetical protein